MKISLSNLTLDEIKMIFKLSIKNKPENKRDFQEIYNLLNYLNFQNEILLNQIKNKNINILKNYLNDYYKLLNEIFKDIFEKKKNILLRKFFFYKIKYQIKNICTNLKRKINKFVSKFSIYLNINEFKTIIFNNSNVSKFPLVSKTNFFDNNSNISINNFKSYV